MYSMFSTSLVGLVTSRANNRPNILCDRQLNCRFAFIQEKCSVVTTWKISRACNWALGGIY